MPDPTFLHTLRRLILPVLGLILVASPCARAQDFERYSPKLPGETGVVDPKKEKKAPSIRREGGAEGDTQQEASPEAAPADAAPQGAPKTQSVPEIRVEPLRPESASRFEDVKPAVPGEVAADDSSRFAEVAPVIPSMPETYVAAIEQAIQPYLDDVLVDRLNGIVFVDSPEKVDTAGVKLDGVVAPALPDLQKAEFKAIASKYLGKPITLRSLNELNKEVVAYYEANDYPVVDVVVPEQDITTGTVQLVVLQARRGEVEVEGNRFFSTGLLASQVRTEEGRIIRARKLMADLNWLNRNPFRRVNLVYTRGEDVGETDLILQVQDRFPVRFYTGYENTGAEVTGDSRFFAGFNWGNAFGLDHQLNYQFSMNPDPDEFMAHSGSYLVPLPWRHLLLFYAAAGTSESNTFQEGLLTSEGDSISAGVRYTVPLPQWGGYEHEISGGFEYKQNTTTLAFGGTEILDNTNEVDHFLLAYTSGWRDALGSTSFTGTVFHSPGGLSSRNTDEDFLEIRNDADSNYTYARATLERITTLPANFSLVTRGTLQLTDTNLLGSEQLRVGGYATVRGYEEGEATGDNGFFTNVELRTPPISLFQLFGWTGMPQDQAQFLLFWDFASVSPETLLPGQDANIDLSSVGPGFRYSINPYLSFRFDYGFQLQDSGKFSRYGSRAHLGLVLSY